MGRSRPGFDSSGGGGKREARMLDEQKSAYYSSGEAGGLPSTAVTEQRDSNCGRAELAPLDSSGL